MYVKAKKHLGQHFLTDETIAKKIVDSLVYTHLYKHVLEIGPGTGVLTKYLLENKQLNMSVVEIDRQSVDYLTLTYPELKGKIISFDFLRLKLNEIYHEPFAIIGNFPYNISSQILFKVLDFKNQIPEIVGMFQKEVAERVAAQPKSKSYGILTILVQAFYQVEYLFTVEATVFSPPPKVKSAVIRLVRNTTLKLSCNEALFIKVVKTAFNQRRKTLRNALKSFGIDDKSSSHIFFTKRAEELSVNDFVELTNMLDKS